MNTPNIAFIGEAPINDHTRQIYARQERAFGYLPNYARLFSHRPEVIDLWSQLQNGLRAHMPTRLFELATLAAALALKSSYCSLAHGSKLRSEISDEDLTQLISGNYEAVVSKKEAAAMRYAALIASNANDVDKQCIDELKRVGFDDTEIFDIAGVAAGRTFFSKFVEGLGAQPDRAYAELPDALKDGLTVGRPIEA